MFQFCVRATSGKSPLPLPPEKYKKNAQNTKKPNAELYFLSHRLNESILLVISQKLSFSIFVWKKFLFSLSFSANYPFGLRYSTTFVNSLVFYIQFTKYPNEL